MFNKVLLPIDLRHESSWRKAMPVALSLCEQNSAELVVMNVVSGVNRFIEPALPKTVAREMTSEAETQLRTLCKENVPEAVDYSLVVRKGSVYRRIFDETKSRNIDLIVMASHRSEMEDYLLGSNAARVVRHASCSVFIVREG